MAAALGAAWRSRDWLTYGKEPASTAEVGGYRLLAAQALSNGPALLAAQLPRARDRRVLSGSDKAATASAT
jgi:hypothetical protein